MHAGCLTPEPFSRWKKSLNMKSRLTADPEIIYKLQRQHISSKEGAVLSFPFENLKKGQNLSFFRS